MSRPCRLVPFFAGLAILLGLARPAAAHPLDLGYLRIEGGDGGVLSIELDLEASVGAELAGVADPAAVSTRAEPLAAATYRSGALTTDAGACTWGPPSASVVDKSVRQTARATCPAGARSLRWEMPYLADLASTFQILAKVRALGEERVVLIDRHDPVLALGGGAGEETLGFAGFVWSGIEHIGAAPGQWRAEDGGFQLADGIDHILFLLALLLGGGSLLRLVGIATGFTVGHSITLVIAALDIVRPPAEVIEPLVALTIAVAALEAFTGKLERHRWKIALGFGLIHGFAFASALFELELSGGGLVAALFGYNLGVELGQVAIVLVAAPLVMLIHRDPKVRDLVVRVVSSAIFVAGMYWFFDRTLG